MAGPSITSIHNSHQKSDRRERRVGCSVRRSYESKVDRPLSVAYSVWKQNTCAIRHVVATRPRSRACLNPGLPRSPFSGAAHAHRVQQILASLGIAHAHARPWFPLASRISCLERKLQVEEGRRKHGGARHALIPLKYKKTPRSRANWLRLPPAFLFVRHRACLNPGPPRSPSNVRTYNVTAH